MTEFQQLMRARDDAGLRRLFSPAAPAQAMDAVLAHMVDCAIGYREGDQRGALWTARQRRG
jgi:hypothetical protein